MRRFGPSSAVARLFGVTFVFLCTDVVISSGLGRQSGCTWEESSKAAAVGGDSLPPRLFRPNQSSPDVHVDYIVYSVTSNWHQVAVTGTPFPSEQRLEALDSFLVSAVEGSELQYRSHWRSLKATRSRTSSRSLTKSPSPSAAPSVSSGASASPTSGASASPSSGASASSTPTISITATVTPSRSPVFHSLSSGVVAGIVIGVLSCVCCTCACVCCCIYYYRWRRRQSAGAVGPAKRHGSNTPFHSFLSWGDHVDKRTSPRSSSQQRGVEEDSSEGDGWSDDGDGNPVTNDPNAVVSDYDDDVGMKSKRQQRRKRRVMKKRVPMVQSLPLTGQALVLEQAQLQQQAQQLQQAQIELQTAQLQLQQRAQQSVMQALPVGLQAVLPMSTLAQSAGTLPLPSALVPTATAASLDQPELARERELSKQKEAQWQQEKSFLMDLLTTAVSGLQKSGNSVNSAQAKPSHDATDSEAATDGHPRRSGRTRRPHRYSTAAGGRRRKPIHHDDSSVISAGTVTTGTPSSVTPGDLRAALRRSSDPNLVMRLADIISDEIETRKRETQQTQRHLNTFGPNLTTTQSTSIIEPPAPAPVPPVIISVPVPAPAPPLPPAPASPPPKHKRASTTQQPVSVNDELTDDLRLSPLSEPERRQRQGSWVFVQDPPAPIPVAYTSPAPSAEHSAPAVPVAYPSVVSQPVLQPATLSTPQGAMPILIPLSPRKQAGQSQVPQYVFAGLQAPNKVTYC